jgi:hypothetical protein
VARGRKRTPSLVSDSQALVRAMSRLAGVLLKWHPTSVAVAMVQHSLTALEQELDAPMNKVTTAASGR